MESTMESMPAWKQMVLSVRQMEGFMRLGCHAFRPSGKHSPRES